MEHRKNEHSLIFKGFARFWCQTQDYNNYIICGKALSIEITILRKEKSHINR